MLDDVRYALRQLRKNPGFALIALTTLAVGIGAAAAMFGLIQGVLLSPPPYADPDRLVLVSPARTDGKPYEAGASIGHWMAWRSARSLASTTLYRWTFDFMVLADGSESLGGMVVTKDYFQTLGLKPMLGREFADAELGRPKTPFTAVIIGYDLWQRKFNGDPQVLGKPLRLSRMPAPLPIVGVMPPGVRFLPDPAASAEPNYDLNAHIDYWVGGVPDESQPKNNGWNVVARLREGATIAQARAETATLATGLVATNPDLAGLTAAVDPVQDVLNADGRRLLVPLFGSVALVFFIACANVAGLLLARGLQRQPEYAMRSALGAGTARLFRQVLTETVVLALVGSLLGAALATGIVRVLKAIGGHAVPRADAVSVGWPVLAFGVLAALIAAIIAGLLPAVRASLPDRTHGLKGTRSSASRAERRLLGSVATLQIVLTVALLAGAALLIRTAQNLANVRPGYDTENILVMTVTSVERSQYKQFHTQALERIAKLPGVSHVAFVWGLPLTGNKWFSDIEIPGRPGSTRLVDSLKVPLRSVTPDYFAAMGIHIAEGRGFRSTDDQDAPPVALINRTMADRYFTGVNPVGRQFRFAADTKGKPMEIIGIVSDTRTDTLSQAADPEVYLSFWQSGPFSKHLIVRASGDPLALAGLVRNELRAVGPTSAAEKVTTMSEIRRESTSSATFAMRLLIGFAVTAMLLAVVGLYGVLSLSVGSRTKEIAVRKAVGAQGHQIVTLVLGEGSRLIAIGLALGLIAALSLGRLLQTFLFDVRPTDPLTLATAAVLFGGIALLACLLPAWRAGRVDLMEALRQE
jgi:putative ABC transport system permease protein